MSETATPGVLESAYAIYKAARDRGLPYGSAVVEAMHEVRTLSENELHAYIAGREWRSGMESFVGAPVTMKGEVVGRVVDVRLRP